MTTVENPQSCHNIRFAFLMIGIGYLFPYNSVVTAVDFFQVLYFNDIDFYLGWLLLTPMLLILSITLKFGYPGSIYLRMVITFSISAILCIVIPLIRNVYCLFFATFILGCTSAILNGTIFGLLGFLGSDVISITQTGLGLSGTIVGLIRILTKIFMSSDLEYSTYLYFLCAMLLVILDIFIYIFMAHPTQRVQDAIAIDTSNNESLQNMKRSKKTMRATEHTSLTNSSNNYQSITVTNEQNAQEMLSVFEVLSCSWKMQIVAFLNYFITLSLFPGVISLMQWDDSNDGWFAIIQIFLFNLFDTIGKQSITIDYFRNCWTQNSILMICICRLIFIPLFVICINPMILSWQVSIFVNILMSISNGMIGTLGFCFGPISKNVPKIEKGRVSQMLAFSQTVGLTLGSSFAFLINYVMNNYL